MTVPVQKATAVEKADTRLGVIVFKCLAVTPDVEDADGDILDPASTERAFYDFMASGQRVKVDIDHKEDVPGKVVAGWYFPGEHVYRLAFKPDDPAIVDEAARGGFAGSSFSGSGERDPL